MPSKQYICKAGETAFMFIACKDQEKLTEQAIADHQLIYPSAHFEFQCQRPFGDSGDIAVNFIALVDNPFINTDGFLELIQIRSGWIEKFIEETDRIKNSTLAFLKTQEVNTEWQLLVIKRALAYARQYSDRYWIVAFTWAVSKVYFFPDFKIEINKNDIFSLPPAMLKERLQKEAFYSNLINTDLCLYLREEYELDLIWLSLVLAEAEMYAEALISAESDPSFLEIRKEQTKAFVFEKLKQISSFEDEDIGLWGLAFGKLNKLASLVHSKM